MGKRPRQPFSEQLPRAALNLLKQPPNWALRPRQVHCGVTVMSRGKGVKHIRGVR